MTSGTTGRISLSRGLRGALLLGAALSLAACEGTKMPFGIGSGSGSGSGSAEGAPVRQASSATLVDRDVEAPEVFEVSDQGLWDGRPSLGGVWVAHPDVKDPERVIIRNPANGKFIIGALFRRERDMPGPRLQVSSDAAGALDMLAGQPAALQVTALRREESAGEVAETDPAIAAAEPIAQTPIGAVASAAIDRADPPATPSATPSASANIPPAPKPAAPAAPAASSGRPYIQIGIFSVEANADRAAAQMTAAGLTPAIRKDESQGKTFWRVIVGPLNSADDRAAAVAKVKGLGYPDAYAVSK